MRRFYTILLALCFVFGAFAETVFTFTCDDDVIQEIDDIYVMLYDNGGGHNPYFYRYASHGPEMRLYPQNTISIYGEGLKNIQIVFTKADQTYATTFTCSTGNLVSGGVSTAYNDPVVDKWTGDADEVSFTIGSEIGKQRVIRKIVINGDPINPEDEIPQDPKPLPTEEDLIDNYIYAEPTTVNVPDTFISQKEYAFIDNNILVYCDKGTIDQAITTGNIRPAFFNCTADHSITFTATENIKGIEIDGFVRKAFNATCEPETATIEYLTNSDYDMEGLPALVIRNINAKSVTLTCPKQLRCYAVRLFFQENPDPLYTGIGSMPESEISIQKILREGRLLIIRGEKIYSAQGIEEK